MNSFAHCIAGFITIVPLKKNKKMKTQKNLFSLLFLSIILLSCEPEVLPDNAKVNSQNDINLFSDTGDQKDIPDPKEGD